MSQEFWNYTIDDSSPLFVFEPYGDAGLDNFTQNGWLPWYTGSGFASSGVEAAVGDSFHITSRPGASFSLQFQPPPIPYIYDNQNSSLVYTGNWSFPNNDGHIPNTSHPVPFHKTVAYASSVSLNFTGVAIAVNGSRDWGHWTYNVTLNDVPVPVMYNVSTMWLIGDTLLFYQIGLDPTQPHSIEVTTTGPTDMALSLNSITVWASDTSTISASSSISQMATGDTSELHSSGKAGKIVGPVVAVIGLIILGATLL
ncbi:hypothetical protein OBBRIDRAFT_852240 [Obba rivulosa]|uniref:Uncharacterized protein n=1 Tax=Obba rivulosa TaxID=1052685 RepID=A0A8E2DQW2_9APHY|nr:hypothetical protein OBBRIDRAFT_852240 [Obba rivulosa]